jgi:ATP-dependent exoDNAse (exonuclease V) beta subunit
MRDTVLDLLNKYDDPKFQFDPIKHKYTYEGKHFISVTQFISRFHEKFDSDYWSKKKAEEAGVEQEEILRQWQVLNDRANHIGTSTHNWIENYYNQIYQPLPNDVDIINRINKFNNIYATHLFKLTPVKFEQRVFSTKWNIAGMIDSIFLYKDKIVMVDYKTNKLFTTNNPYGEKLLYPFQDYDKCHLTEYSIQLSLYKLILKEIGVDVHVCYLLYIGPNEEAKIHKAYDFSNMIEDYLIQEQKKEKI